MNSLDVRYQEKANLTGLKYGIIEATTRCQCSCPGCYMVRRKKLNKGEMSLQQAIAVLDKCRNFIGSELETMDILGGEPLLWRHLKEYIQILLDRKIAPWIFTNMLAITPEFAKWLFEKKVHVTGKLNIDPSDDSQLSLQADMLGGNVKLAEKLIRSIQVFKDAGYVDPIFRLQNLIRKSNVLFVPGYYRWCLENNIGTDLELMGSGEAIDENYWKVAPGPKEIAQMIIQIQEARKGFDLEPAKVLMPHVFGSCPFYDKGLYFAVDGSIRSCSNSTVTLSHIADKDPIEQAWNSPLLCRRRQLCQVNVGEPCHSCNRWSECRGGCRATAEGMGNSFAGYPLCPLPYLEANW